MHACFPIYSTKTFGFQFCFVSAVLHADKLRAGGMFPGENFWRGYVPGANVWLLINCIVIATCFAWLFVQRLLLSVNSVLCILLDPLTLITSSVIDQFSIFCHWCSRQQISNKVISKYPAKHQMHCYIALYVLELSLIFHNVTIDVFHLRWHL